MERGCTLHGRVYRGEASVVIKTDTAAAKARAEALFQQQSRAAGGGRAAAAPEGPTAETAKIEKLRALRLAKEQSDQIAADVRRSRRQR